MWKRMRSLLSRHSRPRGLDASADRHTTAVARRVVGLLGTVVRQQQPVQAIRTDTKPNRNHTLQ
jgi:hypothetical protein